MTIMMVKTIMRVIMLMTMVTMDATCWNKIKSWPDFLCIMMMMSMMKLEEIVDHHDG